MKIKFRLLAFMCAAVVAMAMVVPASAESSGTVTITGAIATTLSIELAPTSISYPSVVLDSCNQASMYVSVTVTSNTNWGATITASSTGTNKLPVSRLYWANGTTAVTCGEGANPGTPFSDGSNTWFATHSQPVTGTNGKMLSMSLALKLGTYESGGPFSLQLLYQVTS